MKYKSQFRKNWPFGWFYGSGSHLCIYIQSDFGIEEQKEKKKRNAHVPTIDICLQN